MKVILSEYTLTDNKINNNTRIAIISDIHSNIKALKSINKLLLNIKPNYILITGDTLDRVDDPDNTYIGFEFDEIGKNIPTYMSLGNHEFYNSLNIYKRGNEPASNYLDFFNNLNNCYSFKSSFERIDLDDISLYSINLPYEYYSSKRENYKYLYDIISKNKNKASKNKFNILLIHSPNGVIKNSNIDLSLDIIKDMNLIICGHNHGGLVPVNMQDKINNHKGLAGPYGTLFPNDSYGIYNNKNTSLLISNGVTKMSKSTRTGFIGKIINDVCMSEVDLINLKHGENHVLKLYSRKKYKI